MSNNKFLHHFEKEGEAVMTRKLGKNARNYAHGYWAFVNMVNREQGEKILEKYQWIR